MLKDVFVVKPQGISTVFPIKAHASVVVCKSGAWPGMRISFRAPTAQNSPSDDSYPMINGEAYTFREGTFDIFWISYPADMPATWDNLVLEVLECATPVILLNNQSGRGWRYKLLSESGNTANLIDTASVDIFADGAPGAGHDLTDTSKATFMPRGYLGGGMRCTVGAFEVHIYQFLNSVGTIQAQLAHWVVNAVDSAAIFSMTFESGASRLWDTGIAARAAYGPILIPWPAYGIRIEVKNISGLTFNVGNLKWLIYERTES